MCAGVRILQLKTNLCRVWIETRARTPWHPAMPQVLKANVFYSGRVQGVGFRYRAMRIAQGFEVAGYVRNLPDGRVQLEAEGAAAEVQAFLDEVAEELSGHIRQAEQTSEIGAGQFNGFTIR